MKVIGLLGGMSWESSLEYYRIINETVKQRLGGLHSAKCILYSVDFQHIETLQHEGNWDELTKIMIESALNLEKAGADMVLICTNTMHKMANEVKSAIKVPLLHIADAAAKKVREKNLKKVGLLGTKYTMEQDFYKGRIKEKYNIDVLIPDPDEREIVHDVIFNELCLGQVKKESRVLLEIFDLLGRKIETIVDRLHPPGDYKQKFIAGGRASGIYIYSIKMENFRAVKKMILIK